jgi:hypothetical protein
MHLRQTNTAALCVMFTLCATNPFIHAKHGNNQSGLRSRFTFALPFALLSLAFAPSANLLILLSVSRLSKVPIVAWISLGRSSPRSGSCAKCSGLAPHLIDGLSVQIELSQLACQRYLASVFPCLPLISPKPATANPSFSEESKTERDVCSRSV